MVYLKGASAFRQNACDMDVSTEIPAILIALRIYANAGASCCNAVQTVAVTSARVTIYANAKVSWALAPDAFETAAAVHAIDASTVDLQSALSWGCRADAHAA